MRPSRIWKDLPRDVRLLAADAFWRDDDERAAAEHVDAIVTLAARLKFRPKSIQALPVERRARQLAAISDVSDAVATRALIAYHFVHARPLMGTFLDAVGIPHDNGLITGEPTPPDPERLRAAIARVRESFDAAQVDLYLRTLAALDAETWRGLEPLIGPSS
jgi:hypothetical protein